jgi:putative intracellular protease/amidase
MNSVKILFVTSSHDKLGDTRYRTGVWLEELAAPYYIFTEAGFELTIASPAGGPVPLDPKSESIIMATQTTKRFLKDEAAMNFLSDSLLVKEVKAEDFDAVFLPGGHGPMWDIADNKEVKQLLEAFNIQNKPIAAVCHGVVGLLAVQTENGELLIKGKQLTGFSNSEEESAGHTKIVPFLLETRLLSLGGLYSKAANYVCHVVVDGNIITGQNPASSEELAKKIVAFLKEAKQQTPLLQPELVTA